MLTNILHNNGSFITWAYPLTNVLVNREAYKHKYLKFLPEVSYQLVHIQGTNSMVDLSARINNIFPLLISVKNPQKIIAQRHNKWTFEPYDPTVQQYE